MFDICIEPADENVHVLRVRLFKNHKVFYEYNVELCTNNRYYKNLSDTICKVMADDIYFVHLCEKIKEVEK